LFPWNFYIRRIAETTTVAPVTHEYLNEGVAHVLQDKEISANTTILRIHGAFLFGATEKLVEATRDLNKFDTAVILRLRNMTALDATGLHAIERFAHRLHEWGRTLLICGTREQPARLLEQADFMNHIGRDNILPHVQGAIERARRINADFRGLGMQLATEMSHRPL